MEKVGIMEKVGKSRHNTCRCGNVNYEWRKFCNRCKKDRNEPVPQLVKVLGEAAASHSNGIFKPEDWQCKKCGNVNWARRQACNRCHASKFDHPNIVTYVDEEREDDEDENKSFSSASSLSALDSPPEDHLSSDSRNESPMEAQSDSEFESEETETPSSRLQHQQEHQESTPKKGSHAKSNDKLNRAKYSKKNIRRLSFYKAGGTLVGDDTISSMHSSFTDLNAPDTSRELKSSTGSDSSEDFLDIFAKLREKKVLKYVEKAFNHCMANTMKTIANDANFEMKIRTARVVLSLIFKGLLSYRIFTQEGNTLDLDRERKINNLIALTKLPEEMKREACSIPQSNLEETLLDGLTEKIKEILEENRQKKNPEEIHEQNQQSTSTEQRLEETRPSTSSREEHEENRPSASNEYEAPQVDFSEREAFDYRHQHQYQPYHQLAHARPPVYRRKLKSGPINYQNAVYQGYSRRPFYPLPQRYQRPRFEPAYRPYLAPPPGIRQVTEVYRIEHYIEPAEPEYPGLEYPGPKY